MGDEKLVRTIVEAYTAGFWSRANNNPVYTPVNHELLRSQLAAYLLWHPFLPECSADLLASVIEEELQDYMTKSSPMNLPEASAS